MKKYVLIGGIISLVFATSCKKPSDNCEEEKLTAAFVFNYPDTVQVGEAFILDANYVVENTCGEFGRFEAERINNKLEVRLKTYYKGCDCEDGFIEKNVNYPIIFEDPATYELKFWVAEEEYESYVIVAVE